MLPDLTYLRAICNIIIMCKIDKSLFYIVFLFAALGGMAVGTAASAAEPIRLTIKNHRFVPNKVTVPAGQRLQIEITNTDPTPEEFESSDLRVEKIIVPGGKITVSVGPLKVRVYKFFGDYHPDTAAGILTAVEPKKVKP